MQLISVSVGQSRKIEYEGRSFSTAIFKYPVAGRVPVRTEGLDGDQQADRKNHGGPDKAVFVYPHAYYAEWAALLDRTDLAPGAFGENLTVSGLTDDQVNIGDKLRIGDTVVQVSQPRNPCYKLSARLNDSSVLTPYLERGLVGYYVRVLEPGTVAAGDEISLIERAEGSMSVRQLSRLYHYQRDNLAGIQEALQITTLANAWREPLAKRLAKLQETKPSS
jgi:MOSC domain-containing protein YiiM